MNALVSHLSKDITTIGSETMISSMLLVTHTRSTTKRPKTEEYSMELILMVLALLPSILQGNILQLQRKVLPQISTFMNGQVSSYTESARKVLISSFLTLSSLHQVPNLHLLVVLPITL